MFLTSIAASSSSSPTNYLITGAKISRRCGGGAISGHGPPHRTAEGESRKHKILIVNLMRAGRRAKVGTRHLFYNIFLHPYRILVIFLQNRITSLLIFSSVTISIMSALFLYVFLFLHALFQHMVRFVRRMVVRLCRHDQQRYERGPFAHVSSAPPERIVGIIT